jgi:uncharacterized membrane protein YfcA
MAMAVSVPRAAAILMPLLLAMDLMGIAALRKECDRKLLRFLLPWGLLGTLVGAVMVRMWPAALVAGVVGIFTLIFLAQRLLFPPHADGRPPPRWLGAVLTVTSGFTSFVSHAGGPPITAYVLPLRLQPVVFAATMSWFFFFVNLSKWPFYGWLGLLDSSNFYTALALMPFAPLGVWVGVRMARRVDPVLFYRLIYLGLFLTGVKLVWDGFF